MTGHSTEEVHVTLSYPSSAGPCSARRRPAYDEVRLEHHVADLGARVGDDVEERVGGDDADLVARLADRGERDGGRGGEVAVDVADHRAVVWPPHPGDGAHLP